MIGEYSKSLRMLLLRGEAVPIAAALLIALAMYYFLQTLVEGLIAPAVAALFNEPSIYLLRFTVDGTDFAYGSVLAGLILLSLVFVVLAAVSKVREGAESRSTET